MGRLKIADFRRLRRRNPRLTRRGLETVEAALLFPLLLLFVFGALEYGWMFLKQQQVTNVARQGARLAATPSATVGDVTARVTSLMNDASLGSSGYTLNVSSLNTDPGSTLTVTISVPYNNITITHMTDPSMIVHLPAPATLSATVAMAKEGP
jgi:Flp pilus assembly protein TadG